MNRNAINEFDRFVDTISNDLARTSIGMHGVLNGVRNALGTYDSYPPFNFEQMDETHWRVTFALAGFVKEDIVVTYKESWLTIEGAKPEDEEPEVVDENKFFHHRGIATRDFKRVVQLAKDIFVKGANMENGLLNIDLEQLIPEEKKPKTIKIK